MEYGRFYNTLQSLREKSDYNCFYDVDEQDVIDGMEKARKFIKAIESLISI